MSMMNSSRGSSRPADLQSVNSLQTAPSSISTASFQVPGSGRRRPRRRQSNIPGQSLRDNDYHFHETPLGLFESFFAESEQYHCTFVERNNPGRILSDSPESSEPDSSDDDDDDDDDDVVTNAGQEDVVISTSEKGKERLKDGPAIIVMAAPHRDEIDHEAEAEGVTDNSSDNDTEGGPQESAAEGSGSEKTPFVPDDDLFKDRWFPDPWERRPGQMWTKAIQIQHNLRAAIKERGFTGTHAEWLYNQIQRRKGRRFPYNERVSLKKPGQRPTEYLAALKQRRDDEKAYANQVTEYDEEAALEECRWAVDLFNTVYGSEWLDIAAQTKTSTSNLVADEDEDGDGGGYEDDEPASNCRKTRQDTSTTEPPVREKMSTVKHGITLPAPDERASAQEIEQRNKNFSAHKARMMEAARIQREEEGMREFRQSANNQQFSKGFRQRWREGDSAGNA